MIKQRPQFNPNYFGAPELEKKYNENHDEQGRFSSGGGSGTVDQASTASHHSAGSANEKLASYAVDKSKSADAASKAASSESNSVNHSIASTRHSSAASIHSGLADKSTNSKAKDAHMKAAAVHSSMAEMHRAESTKMFTSGNHGSMGSLNPRTSSEGFRAGKTPEVRSSRI